MVNGIKIDNMSIETFRRNYSPAFRYKYRIKENVTSKFNDVDFLAKEVTLPPFFDIDKDELILNNKRKYFPRRASLGDVGIRFLETEDYQVTKFLQEWKKSMFSSNGGYILKNVKKSFSIYVLEKNVSWVRRWELKGVFLRSTGDIGYSYDDFNVMEINTTFSVDDINLV